MSSTDRPKPSIAPKSLWQSTVGFCRKRRTSPPVPKQKTPWRLACSGAARQPRPINAGRYQADLPRVEVQQHVARANHDLPAALGRRRNTAINGPLDIKQRILQDTITGHRDRREDLPAGAVGRESPRIAARMDDEDPQGFQDLCGGVRARNQAATGEFPIEDRDQAVHGAASAPHAAAVGVGQHKRRGGAAKQSQLAAQLELAAIARGLGLVASGKNQVVPRSGDHSARRLFQDDAQPPHCTVCPSSRQPS